jgi:hypothetical protein
MKVSLDLKEKQMKNLQKIVTEVHRERCDKDLLYAVLFDLDDETKLNQVIRGALTLITKKNSPDMADCSLVMDAHEFLRNHERCDPEMKRFYLLFILYWETEVQEFFKQRMSSTFLPDAEEHFKVFLTELGPMVEATMRWPCSEKNIVDTVRNFVNGARKAYVMN